MKLPRILITATGSGSGKTTAVCALLAALKRRGLKVSAAKCGPDYIDPMFHRAALGMASCNLDTFLADAPLVRSVLARTALRANAGDLTVIEGAMGYFDGIGGTSSRASSYETGQVTDTPAILVLNGRGAGASCAAAAEGFLTYRADIGGSRSNNGICGFLLNRVSPSYYPVLKSFLEERTGLPVLGYLPDLPQLRVPSRHLGLISPEEMPDPREYLSILADCAERCFDLSGILGLGRAASDYGDGEPLLFTRRAEAALAEAAPYREAVRVAVAVDEAFSFQYQENEDFLSEMGLTIIPFSPLRDSRLPGDISGLVLPGGYPERFAAELSGNRDMLASVRMAIEGGLPCAAECGGFLYLLKELEGEDGGIWPMAGVLPGRAFRTAGLRRFGYCSAKVARGGLLGPAGSEIRGHEFHHWDVEMPGGDMLLTKPSTGKSTPGVYHTETLAAGFPHFYYPGSPGAAASFALACRRFSTCSH